MFDQRFSLGARIEHIGGHDKFVLPERAPTDDMADRLTLLAGGQSAIKGRLGRGVGGVAILRLTALPHYVGPVEQPARIARRVGHAGRLQCVDRRAQVHPAISAIRVAW